MLSAAVTLRNMGELGRALKMLQKASRAAPRDAEVLANTALALSHSGREPEAIGVYERAVKARPDFTEAYIMLADACANVHDYACATRNYRAALKVAPDNVAAVTGLVVKRAYVCDWQSGADGEWARLLALSTAQVDARNPASRVER